MSTNRSRAHAERELKNLPWLKSDRRRAQSVRYSPDDIKLFKTVILDMQRQAMLDLRSLEDSRKSMDWSGPSGNARDRDSFPAMVSEQTSALIGRQLRLIKYLDAALERIRRNRYGRCLSCGALISKERLLAVPHTQLCIRCKQGDRSTG